MLHVAESLVTSLGGGYGGAAMAELNRQVATWKETAAYSIFQSVLVDVLKTSLGYSESTALTVDWFLHISTLLSSVFFVWSVETAAPLFVALCLFLALMILGMVVTAFGAILGSSLLIFLGAFAAFSGSIAVHPWMTVFAADQLPQVKSYQRSTLFLYAFSSMYFGIAFGDAFTPWCVDLLGSVGVLFVTALVLAAATVLFLFGNKESVKISSGRQSSLAAVWESWWHAGFDISDLSEKEIQDVVGSGNEDTWYCWVDRAFRKVSKEKRSLAKMVALLIPYGFVLCIFHVAFGSLELNATLHGASTVGYASSTKQCLGFRQLEIIKAVYALALVPILEGALLPALWVAPEAAAKPTPLRRAALGMFIGAMACFWAMAASLVGLIESAFVVTCVMQIFRTAMIVMSEVLVGGACIEFAYACGVLQSSSGRIAATWIVSSWITVGENISSPALWLASAVLPTPVMYLVCALLAVGCGLFFVPRAWVSAGVRFGRFKAIKLPGSEPEDDHVAVNDSSTLRKRKVATAELPS